MNAKRVERRIGDRRVNKIDRRSNTGRRSEDTYYPEDKDQLKGWIFSAIDNQLTRFRIPIEEFRDYVDQYISEKHDRTN